MKLPSLLGTVRTLASPAVIRHGTMLATLSMLERLLVSATAWALFSRPPATKILVSLAFGAALIVRAFLVRSRAVRTESELMGTAIESVLAGDVLQASVLPEEDARAEMGQSVYLSSQQLAEVLPALAGDLAAALVLMAGIASVEPIPRVLAAVAFMSVAALGLALSRRTVQRAATQAWALHEVLQDTMVDAVEGRLEVVAWGQRDAFALHAREQARAWGRAGTRMATSALLTSRLPMVAVAGAMVFLAMTDSRLQGMISMPLADVALLASAAPAFAGIGHGVLSLTQAQPWLRALARIIEGARPRPRGVNSPVSETILFEAVSFRYRAAGTEALRNIDFEWGDERVIALVGANGSGKSTWLRLMLGLGIPSEGVVRVGGLDLALADCEAWRRSVAFLAQRPYLAMRSDVRTTMRMLAPEVSDSRVREALQRVGLLDLLQGPGGDPLATVVGTLSVGQRQRLALARMLCRDATLFVLDEPDANLDRAGIALVADLVRILSDGHKILLAAHTPELIRVANRVIELENGCIVRDELQPPLPDPGPP